MPLTSLLLSPATNHAWQLVQTLLPNYPLYVNLQDDAERLDFVADDIADQIDALAQLWGCPQTQIVEQLHQLLLSQPQALATITAKWIPYRAAERITPAELDRYCAAVGIPKAAFEDKDDNIASYDLSALLEVALYSLIISQTPTLLSPYLLQRQDWRNPKAIQHWVNTLMGWYGEEWSGVEGVEAKPL